MKQQVRRVQWAAAVAVSLAFAVGTCAGLRWHDSRKAMAAGLAAAVGTAFAIMCAGEGIHAFAAGRAVLEKRRTRCRTARAWRERLPVDDAEFLADCGVPPDGASAALALSTRRALAECGGVPPEAVRADDSLAEPVWDDLWWSDVFFRIEKEAWVKVRDWGTIDGRGISLQRSELRVRDLVASLGGRAEPIARPRTPRPKPPAGSRADRGPA